MTEQENGLGLEKALPPVIELSHVSYIYGEGLPGATKALDDISLTVEKGEFIGIIGHTGCGKSTLITHLNGLYKPASGKVLIDGEDIWEKPEDIRKIRFRVGLVFQYPEYQLFEETVYKDIAYGPKNMGLSDAEVDARVKEAAAFCGIEDEWMEKSPFELSGGQKRRVAVAGVIAMRPEVLVLDEPAAGLDPGGRRMILSQIKDFHEKSGTTVLLVSHSMEDITRYAEKVLVMDHGTLAMFAPTEEVFAQSDRLLELGLSVPQITQIFLGLKKRGMDITTDVYTMDYAVKKLLAYRQNREGESR